MTRMMTARLFFGLTLLAIGAGNSACGDGERGPLATGGVPGGPQPWTSGGGDGTAPPGAGESGTSGGLPTGETSSTSGAAPPPPPGGQPEPPPDSPPGDSGEPNGPEADGCDPSQGSGGSPGSRDLLGGTLVVPSSYAGEPTPLLIALHGSGQPAQSFASDVWSGSTEPRGVILYAPESSAGPGGWSASDIESVKRARDKIEQEYNVERCRVYLTGHSAGGHMTYAWGLAESEIYASLGTMAASMSAAEQLGSWPGGVTRLIPVAIVHGRADSVVPFSAAEMAKAALEGAGHQVYWMPHDGNHSNIERYQLDTLLETMMMHELGNP